MIRKIISGGQTGADQGALHGATLAGVATGGTAPKGWMTEDGPAEELLWEYNLRACANYGYSPRTEQNVLQSNGTLIVGDSSSPGSRQTIRYCQDHEKPFYGQGVLSGVVLSTSVDEIANWVFTHEIQTLNVAGNRESRNPGIFDATSRLVLQLCGAVNGQ